MTQGYVRQDDLDTAAFYKRAINECTKKLIESARTNATHYRIYVDGSIEYAGWCSLAEGDAIADDEDGYKVHGGKFYVPAIGPTPI